MLAFCKKFKLEASWFFSLEIVRDGNAMKYNKHSLFQNETLRSYDKRSRVN